MVTLPRKWQQNNGCNSSNKSILLSNKRYLNWSKFEISCARPHSSKHPLPALPSVEGNIPLSFFTIISDSESMLNCSWLLIHNNTRNCFFPSWILEFSAFFAFNAHKMCRYWTYWLPCAVLCKCYEYLQITTDHLIMIWKNLMNVFLK